MSLKWDGSKNITIGLTLSFNGLSEMAANVGAVDVNVSRLKEQDSSCMLTRFHFHILFQVCFTKLLTVTPLVSQLRNVDTSH